MSECVQKVSEGGGGVTECFCGNVCVLRRSSPFSLLAPVSIEAKAQIIGLGSVTVCVTGVVHFE